MLTKWIDAADFKSRGGWQLDTQFVRETALPYLIACNRPGEPAENAVAKFTLTEPGTYRFFVRTKNWKPAFSPGKFNLLINGSPLPAVCGARPQYSWYWDIAGDLYLPAGTHTLALKDLTGWLSRTAAVIVTNNMDFFPAGEPERFLRQRAEIKGLSQQIQNGGNFDFIVVGGGPGGVPAAIAAARKGLKVALIQDRPVVGGNASDEGTVGLDGAGGPNKGAQETGIANEIKCVRNRFGLTWQGAMEKLVAAEPNLTLFTNTLCTGAKTESSRITEIECTNTLTLQKSRFTAPLFADCTGDCWLAYYAGALYHLGREGRHELNESVAPESGDLMTMSGCLRGRAKQNTLAFTGFYAEDTGRPAPFTLPDFATKLPEGEALCRNAQRLHSSEWWLEQRNDFDDLYDAEHTRDELFCLTLGYFDWLKNSSPLKEKATNYAITKLSIFNAKRENRRVVGDYLMNYNDFNCNRQFADTVAYCGWNLDLHHVKGIFSGSEGPFFSNTRVPPTPIPYRCLYSKNILNLFVASRGISVSHAALGSTRVESTIATLGQVVGTAAALCKKYGATPRTLGQQHLKLLQQQLLLDDQTAPDLKNKDEQDLARGCTVTATATAEQEVLESCFEKTHTVTPKPENLINGLLRDTTTTSNGWYACCGLPQSVTLTLPQPATVGALQITTDTDLFRPFYSYHEVPFFGKTATKLQAELLTNNGWQTVGTVQHNFLRQMRLSFTPQTAKAVRITVLDSADHQTAKLFEVRIYSKAADFEK